MDPIFVLEFDKKKYYETLNEQKKLMQNETNNSNDWNIYYLFIYLFISYHFFIGTVFRFSINVPYTLTHILFLESNANILKSCRN